MFKPIPILMTSLEQQLIQILSYSNVDLEVLRSLLNKISQGSFLSHKELDLLGGKQVAAEIMGNEIPFDTALPQMWLDYWAGSAYRTVLAGTVWAYPIGHLEGMPFPVEEKAMRLIEVRETICT